MNSVVFDSGVIKGVYLSISHWSEQMITSKAKYTKPRFTKLNVTETFGNAKSNPEPGEQNKNKGTTAS
jgi:hypothetical protein